MSNFKDDLKVSLLEAGGVDNWSYYGESISDFAELNSMEWDEVTADSSFLLVALESGGVDNWSGYGDSLEGYYEYCDYLDSLKEDAVPIDFEVFKDRLKEEEDLEEKANELEAANIRLKEEEEKERLIAEAKARIDYEDLFSYIQKRHPEFSLEEVKGVYDALVYTGPYCIFDERPLIEGEFARAKSNALALKSINLVKEFKTQGRLLLLQELFTSKKINPLIDRYLVSAGKIAPKYFSQVKVSTSGKILRNVEAVQVVLSNGYLITVKEEDKALDPYLSSLKTVPTLYNFELHAKMAYAKDKEAAKEKLEKMAFNIRYAQNQLGLTKKG